ncbi:efflux RND transporter periplasmic adaptor subunit [Reichenbachiella sp. MSK19-1]|uniref:efflux RND transporter periplasmic adaptor subunit n=1 Tax=Reichenbachiella sp. MSK19-1 TaxID=1897631 RepID=UPI000E6D45F0|nr:efflux RND transporter periplasmic adaptor subunit [Reichenbachiella sp. MSK19-1]RJE71642.1 hypothetical protein BGP76_06015 [Reichenbachiella sp. MSK19-1]
MEIQKSKTSKIIVAIAAVTLLGGWTIYSLLGNAEEVKARVYTRDFSIKVPVKVAKVEETQLEETRRYLGTFEANRAITITSQTQGEVLAISAQEGDQLPKNGLIATVDSEQIRFQLIAATAAYEDAKREYDRYQKLTDNNAVAKINLEKASLQLASAESNLKLLNKQLRNTKIKAPFAGTLATRTFDVGSVLAPGRSLGSLIDISHLKLVISVPEDQVMDFEKGKQVTVKSDVYPTHSYTGTITMVSDQADEAHKFDVQVKIQNTTEYPIKSGMYGWIEHTSHPHGTSHTIPATAMMGSSKDAKVYKIIEGKAILQPIKVGMTSEQKIEVKEGLTLDDIVVTNGQINLSDGVEVSY